MACPRCGKTHANRDQVRACVKAWTARRESVVSDKGSRGVVRGALPPGLEVAPGCYAETGIAGFFAFAREEIGNFPICWKRTATAATMRGLEFMQEVREAKAGKKGR